MEENRKGTSRRVIITEENEDDNDAIVTTSPMATLCFSLRGFRMGGFFGMRICVGLMS